jgi:glucose-6-phosphate 1-dehydrogenase
MDANRSGGGNGCDACTVVLFGASGDLAKRKVIPAMFDLARHNSLGPQYAIVGYARTPMNDESFRGSIGDQKMGGIRFQPLLPTGGIRQSRRFP